MSELPTLLEIKNQVQSMKDDDEKPKKKKKRGRPRKIENKEDEEDIQAPPKLIRQSRQSNLDLPEIDMSEDEINRQAKLEIEREDLIQELSALAVRNPDILTKKTSGDILSRIRNMNINELKERIMIAKLEMSNKLNNNLSDGLLEITNRIFGKTLKCYEELKQETDKDVFLKESTNELLSLHLLGRINIFLRVGALYGSNLIKALAKNKYISNPQNED